MGVGVGWVCGGKKACAKGLKQEHLVLSVGETAIGDAASRSVDVRHKFSRNV